MPINPYATPQSDLENRQENKSTFFVVSPTKLAVMFVMTMGCYYWYGSYKNWKLYKDSTSANIWPFVRAGFGVFFAYSLFQRVDQSIRESGRSFAWRPRICAVALMVSILLGMFQGHFIPPIPGLVLSLVLVGFNIYLLVSAQRAINFQQNDPQGAGNARFTLVNYAWMLPGLCFWGLTILGAVVVLRSGSF